MLDESGGEYWQLNTTGAVIAEGLLEGLGMEEVCTRLVDEFDVEAARAQADVEALAAALHEAGLLVAAGAS